MKLAIAIVVIYGLIFHTTLTIIVVVGLAVLKAFK